MCVNGLVVSNNERAQKQGERSILLLILSPINLR